jgi:hypothetical protein
MSIMTTVFYPAHHFKTVWDRSYPADEQYFISFIAWFRPMGVP